MEPSSTDSNMRRWKTAKYWDHFLQTAEKYSIFVAPGVNYNMLGLKRFVFDMAGNAIKTYIDIEGREAFDTLLQSVKPSNNPKYDYLRYQAKKEKEEKLIKQINNIIDE